MSKKKKYLMILLIVFISICFLLIFAEVLSSAYLIAQGSAEKGIRERYQSQKKHFFTMYLKNKNNQFAPLRWAEQYKAHFYFGHVCDSSKSNLCNNHGFFTPHDFPYEKSENEFVVGLFGGSVANQLGRAKNTEMIAAKYFGGLDKKKITFINFSIGASKQPQTHAIVSHYASMVDAIIILDGFNDVQSTSYPIFPISSPALAIGHFYHSKEITRKTKSVGRLRSIVFMFYHFADYIDLLEDSATYLLITTRLERWAYNKVYHYFKIARKNAIKEYQQTTQSKIKPVKNEVYELVKHWKTFTRYTHYLAEKAGVKIIHFIQPNQYLKDSKVLSPEELQNSFEVSLSEHNNTALRSLIIAMKELKKEGLNIYNLTKVFKDYSGTVYKDTCCHLNGDGIEILREKMFYTSAEYLKLSAK